MKPRSNFHTHTTYCDGNSTPEEIVIEAINKGFSEIGFSSHSHTPFDLSYAMSQEGTKKYVSEINALKEKYKDKIKIYLGIEQDYYSDIKKDDFDYIIGSVHYIKKGDEYIDIDSSIDDLISNINRLWNGDVYAFIEDYYTLLSDIVNKTDCNIIGHFDIIRKFNEVNPFFSETHPRYVKASESALHKLLKTKKVFEINTGAISRGYMKTPYPSEEILSLLNGENIVISSDSHDKSTLDFYFEEVTLLAEKYNLNILTNLKEIKSL